MLDLAFIRDNPDRVRAAVQSKREKVDLDRILALDAELRKLRAGVENLRMERNAASEAVGKLKKEGKPADEIVAKTRGLGDRIKSAEEAMRPVEAELQELLRWVPNCPASDVPVGVGSEDNVEVRRWGAKREFAETPLAHWDICSRLDIVDFERGARLAGSGFMLFKGHGARLERALINFMLDLHTKEHHYTEISPPAVANSVVMTGSAQLPKLEADMYRLKGNDLYLIPTGEVPLVNIHAGEILDHKRLPLYYTAYTSCFRREAGAAGKDTRGLIRVHQFDKVELVKVVRPEKSYEELESLVANAERVLQLLGLHYRVVKLCTGDMSFASAKTYDLEAWAPGVGAWLEVSSCSNVEDFQARRANIRFRDDDKKVKYVHLLNGSGLALPRIVIALLENYQRPDGGVDLPEPLRPYMGGLETLR
ncbi:MAG: serine--tRNA ligase [Planctomycetota bacterium]|nr:serine--tRNA ligase [Planctomycetota bacterium]